MPRSSADEMRMQRASERRALGGCTLPCSQASPSNAGFLRSRTLRRLGQRARALCSSTLLLGLLLAFGCDGRSDELPLRVAAVPNPRASYGGWVSDPSNLLALRKQDIDREISALERETGWEIAVAVVPTLGGLDPKEFATALFAHWHVGKRKRDNGVLVLHVLDARRIEIETGYGAEGVLPDVKCAWILEDITKPFFQLSSFADGHYETVRVLVRAIGDPDLSHAWIAQQAARRFQYQPGERMQQIAALAVPDPISRARSVRAGYLALWGLALLVLGSALPRLLGRRKPVATQILFYRRAGALHYVGACLVAIAPTAWEWAKGRDHVVAATGVSRADRRLQATPAQVRSLARGAAHLHLRTHDAQAD